LCNLSNKNIGDIGALIVPNLLYNNMMVKKLNISCNNISHDGVEAISDCLKNNDSLQELNLSHNMISTDGAKRIADAILFIGQFKNLIFPIVIFLMMEQWLSVSLTRTTMCYKNL